MGGHLFENTEKLNVSSISHSDELFMKAMQDFSLGGHFQSEYKMIGRGKWILDSWYMKSYCPWVFFYENYFDNLTTNDLDYLVDIDYFEEILDGISVENFINIMTNDYSIPTVKFGTGLSFLVNKKQIDLMFCKRNNSEAIKNLHEYDPLIPGKHKFVMLSEAAKEKNLLMSPFEGLYKRDNNCKKSDFITDDVNEIKKLLFT